METFSKILMKTLAGVFAILFVATTALAFVLYNAEQSVFNAELYKQALDEESVYQRLPELIAQELATAAQQPGRSDLLALFRNLSEDEWLGFVTQFLPPAELETLAEGAVTQVMAYLNGESDSAVLSLASLKTHLAAPEGISVIYGTLKVQPDCSLEQLTAIAMGQSEMILCNPPDTFLFIDLRPVVEAEIQAAVALVPDQVTIVSPDDIRLQDLQNLKTLRTIMYLSPLAPLLCLLAITVLAVRSFRDWLGWWGYPLLFSGLIGMLLSGMSRPLATWFFGIAMYPRLPENLPADVVDVCSDLMASVVHNALQPVVLEAGVMALAGLVMVAISILIRVRTKKRAANQG